MSTTFRPRAIGCVVALLVFACSDSTPAAGPPSRVHRIDAALARAAAFLRSRQGQDGAFRSRHYAAFRDGYSLSPLALLALRMAPHHDAAAFRRGVDFVSTLVQQDGAVRSDAAGPSYPLYAIAGALLVLNADDGQRHDGVRAALAQALQARQLATDHGYAPDDASLGGFSYSRAPPRPPAPGAAADRENSANLSATLFAVGALRLSGLLPRDAPVFTRARSFVERCQNVPGDGGFVFSPVLADGNKAGPAERGFRSYGSMTADGVRALLALGYAPDHARVRAAAAWLERHFDARRNPGDFRDVDRVRAASARYYYAWSVAHALRALGKVELQRASGPVRWAEALADALLAEQDTDGSFANSYSELREDDPLVATPLATAALAVARAALTGQARTHRYAPR